MGNEPPQIYSDSLGTEIYDLLGAAIRDGGPTEGDIEFFRRLAAETGGPILEIGCGTGRVASALAAAGFDVVGVDRSAPMLRLAEERRASMPPEVGARLTFVQGDMTTLAPRSPIPAHRRAVAGLPVRTDVGRPAGGAAGLQGAPATGRPARPRSVRSLARVRRSGRDLSAAERRAGPSEDGQSGCLGDRGAGT